jgi:hypothetical protein
LRVYQKGDLDNVSAHTTIKIWNSMKFKRSLNGLSTWVWALTVLLNGDLASGSAEKLY